MNCPNLYIENIGILVTDKDIENNNMPILGSYDENTDGFLLSRYNKFIWFNIVYKKGKYRNGIIDYSLKDISLGDIYSDFYFAKTQRDIFKYAQKYFGLSDIRLRKICGRVGDLSQDEYADMALSRLEQYLHDNEEIKVIETIESIRERYGYTEIEKGSEEEQYHI